ncbi:MAG: B12-binding domain-containing radical SAM protein [Desulfobacteraceae bacterium]|nr:B12-binding domain-containing radical SAM protein [Desulfobacteraceae bacterium]
MKILLIVPDISAKRENQNDFIYFSNLINKKSKKQNTHKIGVLPLALPTLAAITPPDFDVRIIDENIEDIDFNEPVDIVGITFLTCFSRQGYDLADKFREAGVHVALGGVHVTMCTEEALQHADTVFIGEADDTWEEFLNDFKKGNPKQLYKAEKKPDLKRLVIPRWDLVKNEYYRSNLVETSRGCNNNCDYCSVPRYVGAQRNKPVENVIKEIKATKSYSRIPGIHYVYFSDEDIIGNKAYAKKLFKAMIPLNVRWVSQASIKIGMDDELIDLAAKSGCEAVFIGLESIDQENLDFMGKGKVNNVKSFKEAIDKLHSKGIVVFSFMMYGFDRDDSSIFQKTNEFIEEIPIAFPIVNILGPMPGTRFYYRMKSENRLFKAGWDKYDARNVLYEPKKMSPKTLLKGVDWSLKKFYSADAVLHRINRLWDKGYIRSAKYSFSLRLKLTLLLIYDSFSRDKKFAAFIRKMARELWAKKNISPIVIFAALSFYDFTTRLPVLEDDKITDSTFGGVKKHQSPLG